MLIVTVPAGPCLEAKRDVEHLCALDGTAACYEFGVGVGSEQEQVTLLAGPQWVGRVPVAVDMNILIVEASRRVVPLGDLDWTGLVADVDHVQAVHPAVGIVIVGNRVELTVGQLVIYQHPVVIRSDLDVNHPGNLSVVC